MPKQKLSKKFVVSPISVLITMAVVAAAYFVYQYFASANSVSCEGNPTTLGAGQSCGIQSNGGEVAFAYSANGPFAYEVSVNGRPYKTGSGSAQEFGCSRTVTSETGTFIFKVTAGSATVSGGSCSMNGATAPSGTLTCTAESRRAIKWKSSWNNVKDHASLTRGSVILKQFSGASGLNSYTESGLKPNTKYSAVLKTKTGIVLGSATCRTKS